MEQMKKEEFSISFTTESTASEHMHQDVEFIYVTDGRIRVTTLGKTFELGEEDAMIINSNHRHSWLELEKSHVCVLHFDYSMLLEYLDKKLLFFYCNSSAEKDDRYAGIRAIMGDLLSECAVNMDRMTFYKKSLVFRLLNYLMRYFMADEVSFSDNKDDIRVEKMLQYINSNYNRTLSLQEMADFMYMAPSSFSRFFKKRVGITFVEYVNNIRLHFALEDLRYTQSSIAWISENHGFTNASAFCRIFKDVYGMSPMLYRRQMSDVRTEHTHEDIDRQFLKKYLLQNEEHLYQSWKTKFVQANIDCSQYEPWNNPWKNAINLGNAVELLSAAVQKQIVDAKRELGFVCGRVEGFFDSEMHLRTGHGLRIANYTYVDMVLDFLVKNQLKPIISLDNKPKAIIKGINQFVYEKPSEKIFDDIYECKSVLDDFLMHVVRRYGMEEVQNWMFECWYDEFYENTMGISGMFTKIFTGIYQTIKARIPKAGVGGCGLSVAISEQKFRKLIEQWSLEPVTPDFVSINLFPYSRVDDESKVEGKRQLNTDAYYKAEVLKCRAIIDELGWNEIPLYLAEWNLSVSSRNYFNESCGKAALMMRQMSNLAKDVDFAAYMSLCDYTSVYQDAGAFLYGGSGLLNVFGVRKPSYYAMKFMNSLGRYLIKSDSCYMVTTNGYGELIIVCFNAKQLRYKYYTKEEDEITPENVDEMFDDNDSIELTFSFDHVEDGTYRYKEYRLLPDNGSVLGVWLGMGCKDGMDREDIEYLKQVCVPEIKNGNINAVKGNLVFIQRLKACEIKLIRIYK